MNTQDSTAKRKRRSNNKGPLFLIFFIILCSAAIGLAWLYKQGSGPSHDITNSQSDNSNQSISLTNPTNDNIEPSLPTVEAIEKPQQQEEQIKPPDNTIIESDLSSSLSTTSDIPASITRTRDKKTTNVEEQLSAPHTFSQLDQCQQSAQFVRDFFNHLDDQKYIQDFLGDQASEPYFISLIQKLVNNPPVVSRETDDLFTILKNTAHFFRIIGSDNIFILKVILHEEKPQVENVLAQFYTMSLQEDCAKQQFGLDLPKEALYDYAGFFLHTMGGRLYLFRRDSASRLTVSYYSILLIENANREGRNLHGIEIKPPLKLLIPEIENSGAQLLMRDTYLEKLYELENRLF